MIFVLDIWISVMIICLSTQNNSCVSSSARQKWLLRRISQVKNFRVWLWLVSHWFDISYMSQLTHRLSHWNHTLMGIVTLWGWKTGVGTLTWACEPSRGCLGCFGSPARNQENKEGNQKGEIKEHNQWSKAFQHIIWCLHHMAKYDLTSLPVSWVTFLGVPLLDDIAHLLVWDGQPLPPFTPGHVDRAARRAVQKIIPSPRIESPQILPSPRILPSSRIEASSSPAQLCSGTFQ